jgi:hypothetical protein
MIQGTIFAVAATFLILLFPLRSLDEIPRLILLYLIELISPLKIKSKNI